MPILLGEANGMKEKSLFNKLGKEEKMWDYPFPLAIYPSTSTEEWKKENIRKLSVFFFFSSLTPSAELKLENSVNIFS